MQFTLESAIYQKTVLEVKSLGFILHECCLFHLQCIHATLQTKLAYKLQQELFVSRSCL